MSDPVPDPVHDPGAPRRDSPRVPVRSVRRREPQGASVARLAGALAVVACSAAGIGLVVVAAGRAPEAAAAAPAPRYTLADIGVYEDDLALDHAYDDAPEADDAWVDVDAPPASEARVAAGDAPVAHGSPRPAALTLAARPGAAPTAVVATGASFDGVPFVPFAQKRGEFLGAVRLGRWPAERRAVRDAAYANPAGFLVVTPALAAHPVSAHFTLGDFTMRGAARGPAGETYLVLREALVEKLELVLDDLRQAGVAGADMRVLSGFRAPSHNAGVEGAAVSSRHQYGDAADVVLDADGDGRMDDLTGDGRVDRADAFRFAESVERVERRRPDLVGGLGVYDAQGPSGPFLHVDVRGTRSRWGTALAPARRPAPATRWARSVPAAAPAPSAPPRVVRRPGCRAEGEFAAILCSGRGG